MTEKKSEISSPDYQLYLKSITEICDSSRLNLVQMNWHIGEQIAEISETVSRYGSAVIENLSRDLSQRYGKGYSKTNLKNMRTFFREYKKKELSHKIEWSSYILLLTVKNRTDRAILEKRIIDESLTYHTLRHELARISMAEALSQKLKAPELILTRGKLYTYREAESPRSPAPHGSIAIDCGFNIARTIKLKENIRLEPGTIIKSGKRGNNYSIREAPHVTADEVYTYIGAVERIIDGDTILAVIDCGFSTSLRMRLRLRGINAPEIDTKDGIKARDFAVKALNQAPVIGIKTYRADKYSRYLADIFYLPGETDPHKIIKEGIFLNQQLLDKGLAIKA